MRSTKRFRDTMVDSTHPFAGSAEGSSTVEADIAVPKDQSLDPPMTAGRSHCTHIALSGTESNSFLISTSTS